MVAPKWPSYRDQRAVIESILSAWRALVPVAVRNTSRTAASARLRARVEAGRGLTAGHRWIIVPGERQQVPPAGAVRFLVLVDPPADVATGSYELVLTLTLALGAAGS